MTSGTTLETAPTQLGPEHEKLCSRMIEKLNNRNIRVLAIHSEQSVPSEELQQHLGISEIIEHDSLDDVLEATSDRQVAGVIEIEKPGREVPEVELGGATVDILAHVLNMNIERRLGKIILPTTEGLSAMALVVGK